LLLFKKTRQIRLFKKFIYEKKKLPVYPFSKKHNLSSSNTVIDSYYRTFYNDLYFRSINLDETNSNHINLVKPQSFSYKKNHLQLISHTTFLKSLLPHIFNLYYLNSSNNPWFLKDDILLINYKRRNFFPNISSNKGNVWVTTSLGMFSKMLNKGKSFIRNKSIYLMCGMFLRKVIIYASIKNLTLYIKNQPLYLNEILSSLFKPVVSLYKHPFTGSLIDEKKKLTNFKFNNLIFIQNKSYTYYKTKKRGRLKRKIMKRLIKINNVLD
jgi:hypothetical protein